LDPEHAGIAASRQVHRSTLVHHAANTISLDELVTKLGKEPSRGRLERTMVVIVCGVRVAPSRDVGVCPLQQRESKGEKVRDVVVCPLQQREIKGEKCVRIVNSITMIIIIIIIIIIFGRVRAAHATLLCTYP
jgi:hypothetical protein